MNFEYSEKSKELQHQLSSFIAEHIVPIEEEYIAFQSDKNNMWKRFPKTELLKQKAKEAGLWNLFLPKDYGDLSPGLTNLEYAPLAELMGKKIWISEIFNCSAPDTGNMEVLAKYGTDKQKKQWLSPLMNGDIRSAFFNDRATSSFFRCHEY
jgi:acyl-CoA dehydrogenase